MTWVACFIRHGIANVENKSDLLVVEICSRLHRKVDIFSLTRRASCCVIAVGGCIIPARSLKRQRLGSVE